MSNWRPILTVVVLSALGALGTLAVAAAIGMRGSDLLHLAGFLVPAAVVTIVAMVVARRLLAGSSARQRLVAVAVVGACISLANLAVLSREMFVSRHDATLLACLLVYSAAAGVGAAWVLGRTSAVAAARLAETARSLGEGNLDARVGRLDAGREFDTLAATLDDMAARLQEATRKERGVDKQRRDLMIAVSHDLRTPLASLRAMVEAIDEGVVDDRPSLGRYMGEMRRSVSQLVDLVDDLFELAQLDAGAIEAETRRTRLGVVVGAAVATVETQARDKGLSLSTDLGRAGDAECSPRMARVLQNLLVNAVRHTPGDGTVRIEARHRDGSLEVAVADTGAGIPAQDLALVFEPFYRADLSRSGAGSGLGLTLARSIVEGLGGHITAESRPEAGSRFTVCLPVEAPSQ